MASVSRSAKLPAPGGPCRTAHRFAARSTSPDQRRVRRRTCIRFVLALRISKNPFRTGVPCRATCGRTKAIAYEVVCANVITLRKIPSSYAGARGEGNRGSTLAANKPLGRSSPDGRSFFPAPARKRRGSRRASRSPAVHDRCSSAWPAVRKRSPARDGPTALFCSKTQGFSGPPTASSARSDARFSRLALGAYTDFGRGCHG